jgi:hypothetical protein
MMQALRVADHTEEPLFMPQIGIGLCGTLSCFTQTHELAKENKEETTSF